jgi:GNAT superfamily N-acetyltransferase
MTATRITPYASDRAALRSLFRLADDSDQEIESYLERGSVLVAMEGDDIVGHVQIVDTDIAATCELKSLAVVEARRGMGLGRQLIEAALAHARERRATRVLIATGAADTQLLRFYQRIGFRMLRVERDAFTPAAGYPAALFVDGIRLLDRVWLDLTL